VNFYRKKSNERQNGIAFGAKLAEGKYRLEKAGGGPQDGRGFLAADHQGPEQRAGTRERIYWYQISIFDEYKKRRKLKNKMGTKEIESYKEKKIW